MQRDLPVKIKLPKPEYTAYCEDLFRVACIQIVLQFMLFLRGTSGFDGEFLEIMLYILAGVSFYWLVAKQLVTFR
jgi:hypothetical protein